VPDASVSGTATRSWGLPSIDVMRLETAAAARRRSGCEGESVRKTES